MSEDVWSFIQTISDPQKRQFEIEENALLSDHDLFSFSAETEAILILPKPLQKDYQMYFEHLFPTSTLIYYSPQKHTGAICEDILQDKQLLKKLIEEFKSAEQVDLICYSASMQFKKLYDFFKEKKVPIITPEAPANESYWTVDFFGSKSGIRQLTQTIQSDICKIARGYIVKGIQNTASLAADFYMQEESVVIKTNKGHAGSGVLIFRPGTLSKNYNQCVKQITEKLQKDEYWDSFVNVVESYIPTDTSIGGGFPSAEFFVDSMGRANFLYLGGMRVTKEGMFKGMEIHKDVLPAQISKQMIKIGENIGLAYERAGYRGFFDIDFIIGKDHTVYIGESNVRRTGGTHVYLTAKSLFGPDFMNKTSIISNNLYTIKRKIYSFKTLYTVLTPLLFDKNSNEGIIIVSANLLKQNRYGYIIFGKTKQRAHQIEDAMMELLSVE